MSQIWVNFLKRSVSVAWTNLSPWSIFLSSSSTCTAFYPHREYPGSFNFFMCQVHVSFGFDSDQILGFETDKRTNWPRFHLQEWPNRSYGSVGHWKKNIPRLSLDVSFTMCSKGTAIFVWTFVSLLFILSGCNFIFSIINTNTYLGRF